MRAYYRPGLNCEMCMDTADLFGGISAEMCEHCIKVNTKIVEVLSIGGGWLGNKATIIDSCGGIKVVCANQIYPIHYGAKMGEEEHK